MAAIAWSDVTGMFPADTTLAAIPAAAQTAILAYVNEDLSASYFGGEASAKLKLARIYWAAHMAVSGGLGGEASSGPVTSREEGGVRETYAVSGAGIPSSSNRTTSYGRLFDELVRSSPYRVGLRS